MEPGTVDWQRLMRFARGWSKKKRGKFPKWEFDEIVNEVILAAFQIMPRFDPDKGDFFGYLTCSVWDIVFRRYAEANDIEITRKRIEGETAKWPRRKYINRTVMLTGDVQHSTARTEESAELPAIPSDIHSIIHLLKRGLTQRQVAFALGVHEARISQRMKQLREVLGIENA